jgi:hypothetical protein
VIPLLNNVSLIMEFTFDTFRIADLAEDAVLAIQPRRLLGADEELAAVGVGAGVGHGQDPGASVEKADGRREIMG